MNDAMLLYALMNSPKSPDAGKSGGFDLSKLAMMSMMGGNALGGGGTGGASPMGSGNNAIGDALSQLSAQMMQQRMMNQLMGKKDSGMFGGMIPGLGDKGGAGATNGSPYSGMAAGFGGSPLG